jgi:hypothetical protein
MPFAEHGGFFKNPINVFWGFAYGIGWYITAIFVSAGSSIAFLIGVIGWPLVVFTIIFYTFRVIIDIKNNNPVVMIISLFLAICIVPRSLIEHNIMRTVPLYTEILNAVY